MTERPAARSPRGGECVFSRRRRPASAGDPGQESIAPPYRAAVCLGLAPALIRLAVLECISGVAGRATKVCGSFVDLTSIPVSILLLRRPGWPGCGLRGSIRFGRFSWRRSRSPFTGRGDGSGSPSCWGACPLLERRSTSGSPPKTRLNTTGQIHPGPTRRRAASDAMCLPKFPLVGESQACPAPR